MRKLSDVFIKFTHFNGKSSYVTVKEYTESHPDGYDGDIDDVLYILDKNDDFIPLP